MTTTGQKTKNVKRKTEHGKGGPDFRLSRATGIRQWERYRNIEAYKGTAIYFTHPAVHRLPLFLTSSWKSGTTRRARASVCGEKERERERD